MNDLLVIVLARHGSSRLPGKVVADVQGTPLLGWVLRRLTHPRIGLTSPSLTIVATTDQEKDDVVEQAATDEGVKTYRHPGDPKDVVSRVGVVLSAVPSARWVFVALADCPFLSTKLVRRGHFALKKWKADTLLWYLPPNQWPIYGAREFVFSRKVITSTVKGATGKQREHLTMYFNHNRERFNVLYHDPPPSVYFRHYTSMRLEVDWPEDLDLVRAVAQGPGMLAPLDKIIRWLDKNENIARLNTHRVERTGPVLSYDDKTRMEWNHLMKDARVVTWDNEIREPPSGDRSYPIQCNCGALVGWGQAGILYHVDGHQIMKGFVACPECKTGVNWQEKKESRRGR